MITTDAILARAVKAEVQRQIAVIATAETASQAWQEYGEIAICQDETSMIAYSDDIAAEHLQIHTAHPKDFARKLRNYGSLCISELASVVYSDKPLAPIILYLRWLPAAIQAVCGLDLMLRLQPISGSNLRACLQ